MKHKRSGRNTRASSGKEIQKAIDSIPELRKWQRSNDSTLWNNAVIADTALLCVPTYRGLSFRKRFMTVVFVVKKLTPKPTAHDLGRKFLKMSQSQLDHYLASL